MCIDSTNEFSKHIAATSISEWGDETSNLQHLNVWQEEAVGKALEKPFQLIQGPPGTCNNNCIRHCMLMIID